MHVTGTLGTDWLRKHGVSGTIPDEQLRAWRDYLEARLRAGLSLPADFTIGSKTHFELHSDLHTTVEIEAFSRRALDEFLLKNSP